MAVFLPSYMVREDDTSTFTVILKNNSNRLLSYAAQSCDIFRILPQRGTIDGGGQTTILMTVQADSDTLPAQMDVKIDYAEVERHGTGQPIFIAGGQQGTAEFCLVSPLELLTFLLEKGIAKAARNGYEPGLTNSLFLDKMGIDDARTRLEYSKSMSTIYKTVKMEVKNVNSATVLRDLRRWSDSLRDDLPSFEGSRRLEERIKTAESKERMLLQMNDELKRRNDDLEHDRQQRNSIYETAVEHMRTLEMKLARTEAALQYQEEEKASIIDQRDDYYQRWRQSDKNNTKLLSMTSNQKALTNQVELRAAIQEKKQQMIIEEMKKSVAHEKQKRKEACNNLTGVVKMFHICRDTFNKKLPPQDGPMTEDLGSKAEEDAKAEEDVPQVE